MKQFVFIIGLMVFSSAAYSQGKDDISKERFALSVAYAERSEQAASKALEIGFGIAMKAKVIAARAPERADAKRTVEFSERDNNQAMDKLVELRRIKREAQVFFEKEETDPDPIAYEFASRQVNLGTMQLLLSVTLIYENLAWLERIEAEIEGKNDFYRHSGALLEALRDIEKGNEN